MWKFEDWRRGTIALVAFFSPSPSSSAKIYIDTGNTIIPITITSRVARVQRDR